MLNDLRVLLIEENDEDAFQIQNAFKQTPALKLTRANSLSEALEIGKVESPDVVLLDLSLPNEDGLMNIKAVRESMHSAAIVILTGLDNEEIGVNSIKLGVQEYIVKGEIPEGMLLRTVRFAHENRKLQIQLENFNKFLEGRVIERGKQLQETEEKLSLLVESVEDYAIIMLEKTGEISSWNLGADRIFGYNSNEIVGKSFSVLFCKPDQEHEIPAQLLEKVLRTGKSEDDRKLCKADASSFEAQFVFSRIFNSNGEISGIAFVVRDVSEMRETEARLIQSERLATIGQTVAGLAHESRNSLQRIQSSVNKITRRSKNFPEILPFTRDIEKAVDDLRRLYDTVKKFAAPISLRKEYVSFNMMLQTVEDEIKSALTNRNFETIIESGSQEYSIEGDEFRLKQVFRNLIENSLDACTDPVRLHLSLDSKLIDDREYLQIFYSDNGPGLQEEVASKIFQPFFTTKTEGTGLGMSIVKRILNEHQGEIAITNNNCSNNTGVCFEILIPFKQDSIAKEVNYEN
ncbi:MAG: ATP-binding protein [Bdellovibrionota bacterium]